MTVSETENYTSSVRTLLELAEMIAKRHSNCKHPVGAILAHTSEETLRYKVAGYNIAINRDCNHAEYCRRGIQSCVESEHPSRAIHAEVVAIVEHLRTAGFDFQDTILIVTHKPCHNCLKFIAYMGVQKVYYWDEYRGIQRLDYPYSI